MSVKTITTIVSGAHSIHPITGWIYKEGVIYSLYMRVSVYVKKSTEENSMHAVS